MCSAWCLNGTARFPVVYGVPACADRAPAGNHSRSVQQYPICATQSLAALRPSGHYHSREPRSELSRPPFSEFRDIGTLGGGRLFRYLQTKLQVGPCHPPPREKIRSAEYRLPKAGPLGWNGWPRLSSRTFCNASDGIPRKILVSLQSLYPRCSRFRIAAYRRR